jgi:hypothetical protein
MSKPATVRAEIFRLADFNKDLNVAEKQLEPVGVGIAEPLKLGEQLYITLVIAKPVQGPKSRAEGLCQRCWKGYDLSMKTTFFQSQSYNQILSSLTCSVKISMS